MLAATASERAELITFIILAPVSVVSALGMVLSRNAVYSALLLVLNFFCLAVFYVLLEAQFLAAVQVIVYAGAIMVLFLFVVMVLNVPREDAAEWDRAHPLYRPMAVRVGGVLAVLLALELGWALSRTAGMSAGVGDERPAVSSVAELGRVLFTKYMFAFEVTSILIIAAMVGAVVIARKSAD